MFSNFKNSVIYAHEKKMQSLKKEIAIFGSLRETRICHFLSVFYGRSTPHVHTCWSKPESHFQTIQHYFCKAEAVAFRKDLITTSYLSENVRNISKAHIARNNCLVPSRDNFLRDIWVNGELRQQRRRRPRKRHLMWIRATLNFIALIPTRPSCQMLANFLGLNSKRLSRSSGKEKESACLGFTSSSQREIRHFHVVVVQRRQRKVQNVRDARAKLLFCLSNPIALLPFSLASPSSLLKLPNY